VPLRLNILRGSLDRTSSERNTEARKRWTQEPFVSFTYHILTHNVLCDNNTTLQGKEQGGYNTHRLER
jgi:hypothetical protein